MPSNTNHVCFHCLTAQRQPKTRSDQVYCPQCGRACVRLSYKLALPPKHQPKAWRALQAKITTFEQQQLQDTITYLQWRREILLAEIAQLKQQLQTLKNSDTIRSRLARKLQEAQQQLAVVQKNLYISRTLSEQRKD